VALGSMQGSRPGVIRIVEFVSVEFRHGLFVHKARQVYFQGESSQ
jgi:hypothetical protein